MQSVGSYGDCAEGVRLSHCPKKALYKGLEVKVSELEVVGTSGLIKNLIVINSEGASKMKLNSREIQTDQTDHGML